MGKSEGRNDQWHGHVTALSIAPEFRRIGLAGRLMEGLEQISEEYVVDNFHFIVILTYIINYTECYNISPQ